MTCCLADSSATHGFVIESVLYVPQKKQIQMCVSAADVLLSCALCFIANTRHGLTLKRVGAAHYSDVRPTLHPPAFFLLFVTGIL